MGYQIGGAVNGQQGVGAGYDAVILYRGYGREAMIALWRVSSREWVAMGTITVGQDTNLDALARRVASDPGSFDLAWHERDPETYDLLAEQCDQMEAEAVDEAVEVQS